MTGILVIVGGGIFGVLGAVHVLLSVADVFRPTQFTPTDDAVRLAMLSTTVRFSGRRANLWRAWLGFNISHGMGLIVFGVVAAWLGSHLVDAHVARATLVILLAIALAYFVLALRFWFYAPAIGFALAAASFAIAWWSY